MTDTRDHSDVTDHSTTLDTADTSDHSDMTDHSSTTPDITRLHISTVESLSHGTGVGEEETDVCVQPRSGNLATGSSHEEDGQHEGNLGADQDRLSTESKINFRGVTVRKHFQAGTLDSSPGTNYFMYMYTALFFSY